MTTWMNRVKSSLRRMGDWVTGHDVAVANQAPEPELLENRPTARPPIDVLESADDLMLVADVPGTVPGTARVFVDGDCLTIHGSVPTSHDGHLLLGGVANADWYAQLTLPPHVDTDNIHASLREGVLTPWRVVSRSPPAGDRRAGPPTHSRLPLRVTPSIRSGTHDVRIGMVPRRNPERDLPHPARAGMQ